MATLSQEQEYLAHHHEQGEGKLAAPVMRLVEVRGATGQATIRFPPNQYYNVVAHARAFANAVYREVGADSFGTYGGHSPTPERALDIFSPVPRDRKAPETPGMDKVIGDDVAEFAVENMDKYGIDYVIWRQHIYNPEIAKYWRLMGDRGSITNNHFDHDHMSFNLTAGNYDDPAPKPPKELEMAEDWFRYAYNGQDYVVDRIRGTLSKTSHMDQLKALDVLGVKQLGVVSKFVDDYLKGEYGGGDESV